MKQSNNSFETQYDNNFESDTIFLRKTTKNDFSYAMEASRGQQIRFDDKHVAKKSIRELNTKSQCSSISNKNNVTKRRLSLSVKDFSTLKGKQTFIRIYLNQIYCKSHFISKYLIRIPKLKTMIINSNLTGMNIITFLTIHIHMVIKKYIIANS